MGGAQGEEFRHVKSEPHLRALSIAPAQVWTWLAEALASAYPQGKETRVRGKDGQKAVWTHRGESHWGRGAEDQSSHPWPRWVRQLGREGQEHSFGSTESARSAESQILRRGVC